MDVMKDDSSLSSDLLRGADAIAAFLGASRRQIYHLVNSGHLPVFRMGTKLCARKSRLLSWIEDQENDCSKQSA